MDGVTHVRFVSGRLSASIPIGIDAQITEFCREPLGALVCLIGSSEFLLGAFLGGFGS